LWSALVTLAVIAPADAQVVGWNTYTGFDGACTYGSPVPVLIELTNNGPARKGQLTIDSRRKDRGDDSVRYVIPLDLPENSHKVYSLEVRNPSQRRMTLAVNGYRETRDIDGLVEAAEEDVLFVVISENPVLLQSINRARVNQGMGSSRTPASATSVGHVRPGRMPRSWVGWQGVDIAVVVAERLAEASPEEINALRQWVQLGGRLIVSGGVLAPAMASGPLGDLLPLKVTGTRTINHLRAVGAWAGDPIEDQETLIAAGRAVADARVLCGTPALPLITARDVGAGVVAMTAFDLAGRPVKYWDGQEKMWLRLIDELGVNPPGTDLGIDPQGFVPGMTAGYMERISRTARQHAEPGLPSAVLVFGFLLAYIIVLVPISYIALARRDAREWAWLTTPIIVLIFTFGAYGIGYMSRGGKTIVNRVALVVAQSGDTAALGSGAVAIFSPGSRNYSFGLTGSVASPTWSAETGSADTANIVYGPQRKITGFRINKWSSRSLTADFVADLGEGIEAHAIFDGHTLTAKVTNNSGLPLRGCRILRGQQEGPRVDLASGASGELTFENPTQVGNLDLTPGGDLYGRRAAAERRRAYSEHSLADLAVAEMAQDDPMGYSYGGTLQPGGGNRPYLLAICDQPMLTVDPVKTRARLTDCAIIVIPLEVTISSGNRIAIEDWMVTQTVASTEGTVATAPRYDRLMNISDGAIELDLEVETGGKRCRAKALKIGVRHSDDMMMGAPPASGTAGTTAQAQAIPAVQVWSVSRGEWVAQTSGGPVPSRRSGMGNTESDNYVLESPGDFMSVDGLVRVRLSAHAQVNIIQVSMTGEMETY